MVYMECCACGDGAAAAAAAAVGGRRRELPPGELFSRAKKRGTERGVCSALLQSLHPQRRALCVTVTVESLGRLPLLAAAAGRTSVCAQRATGIVNFIFLHNDTRVPTTTSALAQARCPNDSRTTHCGLHVRSVPAHRVTAPSGCGGRAWRGQEHPYPTTSVGSRDQASPAGSGLARRSRGQSTAGTRG